LNHPHPNLPPEGEGELSLPFRRGVIPSLHEESYPFPSGGELSLPFMRRAIPSLQEGSYPLPFRGRVRVGVV